MDFLYVEPKNDMFSEEKDNLEKNINSIEENIESKNKLKIKFEGECDNYRGDYENRGYFIECNNKLQSLNKELNFLEKVINSPYFGHMILSLDNNIIDIFIGNETIKNSNLDIIVYDWRAPVCNLFYANQTEYRYNNYVYELELKRNLVIKNKELIECVETYNRNEQGNNEINDYFLRKLIKEKKNQKGFTDIIQSIQQKQNEIIRSDLNEDLLCQGVAGSGKTAIIVHRISYLLFNNKNISPEHFLYIAPNDNFKKELNELNKKLQIDKISLKTLYEYYIDKLNYFINSDQNNYIKTIIDDKEQDIKSIYSIENIENKFNIMQKLFLQLIKNYEKKYNLNLQGEESLIAKSKKLYKNILDIIEESKNKIEKIKMNIIALDVEINHKVNSIFMNNRDNTTLEENYLEQIKDKFDKLKQEYGKNDFDDIEKRIKVNKDRISQNELLIKDYIKEKERKSRNKFFTKIFNKNAFNEGLEEIKKIDEQLNFLKDENQNIISTIDKLENILKKKNYLNTLEKLENFAITMNKCFNEIKDKYKYLELRNHEIIDLKIQYKKVMNKIYNVNFDENLLELQKIEYEMVNLRKKIKSVDWNIIKNQNEILNNIKTEFSQKNIMLLYLKNICNKKYDLSEKLSDIEFYRNDIFIILYIINKMRFDNKIQYHYLYIDEAQDYNDQEIKLLKELEKCNINIFGDYKQNISTNSVQRKNWDDLKEIINSNLKYYELNENYRNTINVVNFCNKNLNLNMLAVGTEGNDVEIKENKSIKTIIENAEKKDAVVITNNEHIISKINKKSKIRVLRVKEVKGLEFKNAIVIDDDLDNNSRYIAYTRSLNDLIIYRNVVKDEEEILLEEIEKDGSALEKASNYLKNDKDFILQAIEKNDECFLYASDELKNDKEFMSQLIQRDSLYLLYASETLKNDKDLVLKAINNNPMSLLFASDNIKNNKEIVFKAIEKNPWSLAFASENLKNDQELVLKAIKKDGSCLKYASDELKNNKEFMVQAIENDSLCIEYASDELKNNEEFMIQAIEKAPLSIEYTSNELRNNEQFIKKVIKKYHLCLKYASDELRNDKDFMLDLIEENGLYLAFASDNLKNDKEFILQAIDKDYRCLVFVSDELKNDKEIMDKFNLINNAENHIDYEKIKNDKDLMLQKIEKDDLYMLLASNELKNNEEFMLKIIEKVSGLCIAYASEQLRNNKDFILKAIEKDHLCSIYSNALSNN